MAMDDMAQEPLSAALTVRAAIMPTNLPPEYFEAEERYRSATTPQERITLLEELISTVPKHKGTDKLRADLRRRLSKLKDSAQSKQGVSRHESAFHIDREGAARVAVIGAPNVGKSALVTALTNASPEVADYPFTTWTPTPGMMEVGHVQIQLIDTPPLSEEHVEPALIDLIRGSDLVMPVIDVQGFPIEQLEQTIAILARYRISPERFRERYDEREHYRITFRPFLVAVNKVDDSDLDEDFMVLCELLEEDWHTVPIAAETGRNLDQLRWKVFERLDLVRVYSKPPGEEADLSAPFVMKRGDTLEAFAAKVHRDFVLGLKSARIWGSGAFDGQMIGRDHILCDGDIVELRM
jgi:ribosome-interacting GTPase 1